MSSPFDYVNSINFTKQNMMRGTENDELAEKGYDPFLSNKSLSYFQDTVLLANEMNLRYELPRKLQYEFLLNTVRPKKRFSKWQKADRSKEISIIQEYFGYSREKAEIAVEVLTDDELDMLKAKLQKGGMK
jgi:hypothetical protein